MNTLPARTRRLHDAATIDALVLLTDVCGHQELHLDPRKSGSIVWLFRFFFYGELACFFHPPLNHVLVATSTAFANIGAGIARIELLEMPGAGPCRSFELAQAGMIKCCYHVVVCRFGDVSNKNKQRAPAISSTV